MISLPLANGEYEFRSNSNRLYTELGFTIPDSATAYASVWVKRQASNTFVQYSQIAFALPNSFIIEGSVSEIRVVLTECEGSGKVVIEQVNELCGFTVGQKCRANVQSIARVFPAGVSLVTSGRPNLSYLDIQNRDSQAIYFWHGRVPTDITQTSYLPLDPATWTAGQVTAAGSFISTYGEKIAAGERFSPRLAHTGALYSFVSTNSAIAHVMVG